MCCAPTTAAACRSRRLAPTAGTVIYGLGALLGLGIRQLAGGGDHGVLWVLGAAAVTYVVAGVIPLLLRRDQLGPSGDRPGQTFGDVARGFADGFRVLSHDSPSWRAVVVVLLHRLAFGSLTVLLLLILRNTLNPASDPDAALADFSLIAGAVTAGALGAAIITPAMTRRWGTVRWTTVTLFVVAVVAPLSLIPVAVPTLMAGGLVIGLAQQSAKIGGDYAPGEKDGKPVLVVSDPFVSKAGESADVRRQSYQESIDWYQSLVTDLFGKAPVTASSPQ